MSFPYKKVLVVGATSGIGKALATRLVEQGCKVVVVGRRQEQLDAFMNEHGKDKASAIKFDISDLTKIPAFAKQVTEEHADIDSIFLNSGIQRGLDFTKPQEIDLDMINTEITTNYTSFLHLTVAFLPFLQQKKEQTSFIYTTSGLALVPILRCANYCASKAALHHWILCLREQLKDGPGNIKVIEIFPPAVQTELHDAKHQPDIKNGGQIGMPLAAFVDETWESLSAGNDEVVVENSKRWYGAFEPQRQKAFHHTIEAMKGFGK